MHVAAERESIAAAHVPSPPLAEPRHGGVMQRHLRLDPPDRPAGPAQPDAELGFFAGNEIVAVAPDAPQGIRPHHHVAAAGARRAARHVPFGVADAIVDRTVRVALAAAAEHGAGIGPLFEKFEGLPRPGRPELAIAVDELDEWQVRLELHELAKSRVARAGSGKAEAHVERDHLGALAARPCDRAVVRSGIDIDDARRTGGGAQAAFQAFAFVAADRNHAVGR